MLFTRSTNTHRLSGNLPRIFNMRNKLAALFLSLFIFSNATVQAVEFADDDDSILSKLLGSSTDEDGFIIKNSITLDADGAGDQAVRVIREVNE